MDFVKKHIKDLLILLFALIACVFLFSTCSKMKENKYLENNIKALVDTVQVIELRNGNLMYENQLLILEKNELQKYMDVSKAEIRDLERKLNSQLAYINKLKAEIQVDTIHCFDTLYYTPTGDLQIGFKYMDKYTEINGKTTVHDYTSANTTIDNIKMDVPITLGITDEYKFFATSDNPNVVFSDVNGAAISDRLKKKRWGIGPTVSFGVYGGYDFIQKTPSVGVGAMIGVSLHYDLIQW